MSNYSFTIGEKNEQMQIQKQVFLHLGPLSLLPCLLLLLLLVPSNHYWGTNRPLCQTGRHDSSPFLSRSLSLSYAHSTQPRRFLSLWMKEEVQRRLKCKESSVSSVSLRQEWHHSRQQQQQQRQWQAALPNYSWGLKNATAKELSVYKTHSLSSLCVFKAVPFTSYNPKLTPSKKRFPSQWRPPGLRKEGTKLKIPVSKCLFSNLVEKFAVCHKWRSVAKQDNFVWHLSSYKAAVKTLCAGGRYVPHP